MKTLIITTLPALALTLTLAPFHLAAGPVAGLPHEDDFESYTNSTPLIDGTNGWYASSAAVVVQTNTVYAGTNAAVIPEQYAVLSNVFQDVVSTAVWVRIYAMTMFRASGVTNENGEIKPEVNTNASAAFYIDTNGYFAVHDGPPAPTNWATLATNACGLDVTPLTEGEWARVDVFLDYPNTNWTIFADYSLLAENLDFINPSLTNFRGFNLKNGITTSYIDNVFVTADLPADLGENGGDWLPRWMLGATNLEQSVFAGNNASDREFTVQRTNGYYALNYSVATNAEWLSVSPVSGSSTGQLSTNAVSFSVAGLAVDPAPYTAEIRVAGRDAKFGFSAGTQVVAVVVNVMQIGADTAVISNSAVYGNNAPVKEFAVSNSGAGVFNYVITNDAVWLASVNPGAGSASGAPSTHTGVYASAALDAGTYTGGIYIASPAGGGATQKITAVLTVLKADQAISSFLPADGASFATTDKAGLSAAASSGLAVGFAVSAGPGAITGGTNLSFTGAGSVSVVASQAGNGNWNPAPNVTHTFDVEKAVAAVTLDSLAQVYDGTPRVVSASTTPGGLAVDVTYDGSATAPAAAGAYAVTGVVNDVMYQGAATGTLVVSKADQTISSFLPADGSSFATTDKAGLSAAASSGLAVGFAVSAGPGAITGGTNLSFTGAGSVSVVASQAGNDNWASAPDVIHAFTVSEQPPEGELEVSPASLSNAGPRLHDAPAQSFEVWNSGQGTVSYTITVDVPWLGVNPDSGESSGERDVIAAIYRTASLLPGVHSGTITVTPGAGAPLTLPVSVRIYRVKDDYSGDGKANPWFYHRQSGTWYLLYAKGDVETKQFGWWEAQAVGHDYDGDGKYNPAVYHPRSGNWYILLDGNFMLVDNFGWSEAAPVPGDYNGDGYGDLAVYWPAGGLWFVKTLAGEMLAWGLPWGGPGMTPVPGDYNGDGVDDLALYDQATGAWYVLTMSGELLLWGFNFGWSEALPMTGDFDGDGRSDIAVYHQAAGVWYVFTWQGAFYAVHFGWDAAAPLAGDFDGDGVDDISVFYRDRSDAVWYILQSSQGFRAISSREWRGE